MPSKSIAQQRAMGIAYAAKKGKIPVEKLNGPSLDIYNSMDKKQIKDFAETKTDSLPYRKSGSLKCPRSLRKRKIYIDKNK